MLISTFELLVKRQLPRSITDSAGNEIVLPTSPLSRAIIQGYFLTIANTTENNAGLILNFKSVTSVVELPDLTATFLDTNGINLIGDVIPDVDNAYKYPFELAGNTTCLFILQPDLLNPKVLTNLNIELRGYVDIELDSATSSAELLITPEHRGTFFRPGIDNNTPKSERQLGEIAYSLPTASGMSLFSLEI
jgi:hypothetical protein